MIAGHSNIACLTDLKYNLEREDYIKIAATKKALSSEANRLQSQWVPGQPKDPRVWAYKSMVNNFENVVLPSVYNQLNGYESQSSYYKSVSGATDNEIKSMSEMVDVISESGKYEEGSTLNKAINSIYNYYSDIITVDPTDEEVEQEVERVSRNTKCLENEETGEKRDDKNPLKDKTGYKQLEEWLKKMKGSEVKKKKYMQMSKMSDLQRVSSVEFIKPKAMLMKKIAGKELYCKRTADSERYMHIMTDRSGSMSDFNRWRNSLIERVYDDCTKMNIQITTSFWNCDIYTTGQYAPQKIRSKAELQAKTLSVQPDGGDRMGFCLEKELKKASKRKAKQYILCVSDGTGSLDDKEQRDRLYQLASSKNIEFKFALFSRNNEMYGTNKEDMFYIYD